MHTTFEIQAHRGARANQPENTIPAFETAIDAGADSIETDLHVTGDGEFVLHHDPCLHPRIAASEDPATRRIIAERRSLATLTLDQLRRIRVAGNPDPAQFPQQTAAASDPARTFTMERGLPDPYSLPTLRDLFAFVRALEQSGPSWGKTPGQSARAARIVLDLEIKQIHGMSCLDRLVELIREAGLLNRVRVRSFDHRWVREVTSREARLAGGVLLAGRPACDPGLIARAAGAVFWCAEHHFVDAELVAALRADGIRTLAWTANQPADWERLLTLGVAGITTDNPAALRKFLADHGGNAG